MPFPLLKQCAPGKTYIWRRGLLQWLNLRGIGGLKTGKIRTTSQTGDCLCPYTLPDLRLFQNRPLAVSARVITIGLCSFSVFQASPVDRRSREGRRPGMSHGASTGGTGRRTATSAPLFQLSAEAGQ